MVFQAIRFVVISYSSHTPDLVGTGELFKGFEQGLLQRDQGLGFLRVVLREKVVLFFLCFFVIMMGSYGKVQNAF